MEQASADRFERLCLPHLDSVFRVARRLARDESEADDLVQETYVRAFRAFDRFELREHGVRPWLLKILHNAFYTHRGKSRRQPTVLEDVNMDQFSAALEPTDHGSGLADIPWDTVDEELKHAVNALQPEYRVVLLLWSFEDMSYKEIAEACECAVGTVMSRLYRARQQLAAKLADFAERENVPRKT